MLIVSLAATVLAAIPEPDVIFYGTATHKGGDEPATEKITLVLTGPSKLLASYTPGENEDYGDRYVLRVPMDALDPIEGRVAQFFIGSELAGVTAIPAKGSAVEKNIDTLFDKDSDADGMDDDWELNYFGSLKRDGSGDINGDGYWETCAAHALIIQKA